MISCTYVDLTGMSKDIQLQESLVIPVGEGNISVNDLLKKLNLQNISTNADTINFTAEFNKDYQFTDPNLLSNAQQKNNTYGLTPSIIPTNSNIPITGGNQFSINLGLDPLSSTERFDSLHVRNAVFSINLSFNDIKVAATGVGISPSDIQVTLIFPKMKYIGGVDPVSKDINISQFGQPTDINLSNFTLNTAGSTGIPFQILFKSASRSLIIGSTGSLSTIIKINQIDNLVAYGQFQPASSAPTTIKLPLDILSSLPTGMRFANPKAMITLQSNIGSYLKFNILGVKAYSKDGSTIKQALFNGNPTITESINVKPTNPGETVTKSLRTLDNVYGTTDQLFDTSVKLDTLEYKFSVQTDDALNSLHQPTFVMPGMKMSANVKIQIPFYLKAGSNISLSDTIKNVDGALKNIDNATLVLKVTNGLPIKISYKMKFLDTNNTVITSSINDSTYVINSAQVDSKGIVITNGATITNLNIALNSAQTAALNNAKHMVYTITVTGQDQSKAIQFTTSNYFKVKLGVFAKGKYTTTMGSNK